ncbi:MAG: protein kinase, partial [Lachnospiraceae bacterium]|nr:protein kinase [Lachnospiraceae bacterium]
MQKGDHWRDWEIIELLGSGSFGKVYRIRRSGFDGFTEESALKVIRIPQNDSDYQLMLKDGMDEKSATVYFETMVNELSREFTLMSSLKGNSNIVSFEDYEVNRLTDRFGWEIVIRMELLEPLNESISKYGITAEEIAKVGIDICKALELCEKEKIIHRDINPENIFVSKYGDYKLGDFGIAKKLENATYSHTQMGTLSYMAPEVYQGRPYNATADIYSLGLV